MDLYTVVNIENGKELRGLSEAEAEKLVEVYDRPHIYATKQTSKIEKQEDKKIELMLSAEQYKLISDILYFKITDLSRKAVAARRVGAFGEADNIGKECEQLINIKTKIQKEWLSQ